MPFTFTPTSLPGVTIIEPRVLTDHRGFFLEAYKKSEFAAAGIDVDFVQDNHSRSVQGTLRGLHLQRAPRAQAFPATTSAVPRTSPGILQGICTWPTGTATRGWRSSMPMGSF